MKGNRTRLAHLAASGLVIFAATGLKVHEARRPPRQPRQPRQVDASGITSIVSQHRGRVVLLNFWATWCPPCREEFPEIVALERKYRQKGLVVVSVSADSLDRKDTHLLPFLAEHKPGFEVYVRKNDDPDAFTRTIDPEWKGRLPATFFFDRQGRASVKRYSQMRREELDRIVEYLLTDRE